jgi:S-DNA-T family DNA segregation ATPase FtsK/SpoIIIE
MNLIDIQTPIMIQHKNTPVVIEERRFIESAATKTDNAYLPAEEKIRLKLQEFALPVQMEKTHTGASVTLYTMKPARGCKMSAFENHAKDLALALEAKTIRIEAPIMGTSLVGVEVPNKEQSRIDLLIDGQLAPQLPEDGKINIPIGVDVYGNTIVKALDDMPHLLIAGTTGAGKSVILNSIIKVISMTQPSDLVQLILIDPKRVEFAQFNGLQHLLAPVIVDDEKAAKALQWLCSEMEDRYSTLESAGCRNIYSYNQMHAEKISKIVVVIDEFADLMLQKDELLSGFDIEKLIVKIAQKARAVGIHLVIGTQRPSVDVVTGRIKANMPTRIALMTANQTDSRVILDESGADQLIGHGDMLFMDPASKGLQRLQGFYC